MRIFDPQVLKKNLAGLGLDAHEQSIWEHMVSRSHGMVIVTGPTGSGKSTTLYSALRQLARPELNDHNTNLNAQNHRGPFQFTI